MILQTYRLSTHPPPSFLEETNDATRFEIDVDVVEARASGQAGNGHDVPHEWKHKTSTNRGTHRFHRNSEAGGDALQFRVATEREVCLGYTDREVSVPRRGVPRKLLARQIAVLHPNRAVDLTRDRFNLK